METVKFTYQCIIKTASGAYSHCPALHPHPDLLSSPPSCELGLPEAFSLVLIHSSAEPI